MTKNRKNVFCFFQFFPTHFHQWYKQAQSRTWVSTGVAGSIKGMLPNHRTQEPRLTQLLVSCSLYAYNNLCIQESGVQ